MAGSPKKRARKERAKTFLEEDNAMARICARIVSGPGTLVDVCRDFGDLHYGSVNEWIQSDEDRRKQYKEALDIRKEHAHEHVFRELMTWLKCDITQAFKPDGSLKALEDIPDDVRKFIASMEIEELYEGAGSRKIEVGIVRKLKFFDKGRGLELMAKHLGMLIDKREVSGKLTLEDLLEASNEESK